MEHMNNERKGNLINGTSENNSNRILDISPRKSIKMMGKTQVAAMNTERISPYSILRNSDQVEVQSAI